MYEISYVLMVGVLQYICPEKHFLMSYNTSVWLQNALVELELLKNKDYQVEINRLLDEQAYLMGWLFNLEEDFSEAIHDLIIKSTIALFRSLTEMGLFFQMIKPDQLEDAINTNIEAFENLEEGDGELTENAIIDQAGSPVALRSLYSFIDANTTEDDLPIEARSNLLFVLSTVVDLFEESAASEDPSNRKPTDA